MWVKTYRNGRVDNGNTTNGVEGINNAIKHTLNLNKGK